MSHMNFSSLGHLPVSVDTKFAFEDLFWPHFVLYFHIYNFLPETIIAIAFIVGIIQTTSCLILNCQLIHEIFIIFMTHLIFACSSYYISHGFKECIEIMS